MALAKACFARVVKRQPFTISQRTCASTLSVLQSSSVNPSNPAMRMPSDAMAGAQCAQLRLHSTTSAGMNCDASLTVTENIPTSRSFRTHTCGQLNAGLVGSPVRLVGWVASLRIMKNLIFIVLRDAYDSVQIVLQQPLTEDNTASAAPLSGIAGGSDEGGVGTSAWPQGLRLECVVQVDGRLALRQPELFNPKQRTGQLEVLASKLAILGATPDTGLPVQVTAGKIDKSQAGEDVRLQYRYIDMRRTMMQRNLRVRSVITQTLRNFLTSLDPPFVEIETPTLFRSTPEGAREFLVPTRHPDKFYALTQSPQQYKQLLMVGGCDRYFQVARCYRDESGRADRQPEFTQVDLEMSFVTRADVMAVTENMVANAICAVRRTATNELSATDSYLSHLAPALPKWTVPATPLPRMTYTFAILTYGSDKPDRRVGMPFIDVAAILMPCTGKGVLKQYTSLAETTVLGPQDARLEHFLPSVLGARAFRIPELGSLLSNKEMDELIRSLNKATGVQDMVSSSGPQLALLKVGAGRELRGHALTKGLPPVAQEALIDAAGATAGDCILVGVGPTLATCNAMGTCRLLLAELSRRRGITLEPHHTSVRVNPGDVIVQGKGLEGKLFQLPSQPSKVPGPAAADDTGAASLDLYWVTDFPLFEVADGADPAELPLQAVHHPFTAPSEADAALLESSDRVKMLLVHGEHYDLVCNGVELGGGSIRINSKELQLRVLRDIIRVSPTQLLGFGHLLEGLASGCPPHGGIALGLDRLIATLCQAASLRDVIAFPKSAAGNDLMTGSPASVTEQQLAEYHIKLA